MAFGQLKPSAEKIAIEFKQLASELDQYHLEYLPTKDRGRLKPLDTLARESNLYLTGKERLMSLSPASFFLALNVYQSANQLEIINVRNTDYRKLLNLPMDRKLFSLDEIEKTTYSENANQLLEKEKKNKNLLTPIESAQLEVMNQVWLLKSILSGDMLFSSLVYKEGDDKNAVQISMQNFLTSIVSNQDAGVKANWAKEILLESKKAKLEPQFSSQIDKMGLEVSYNNLKLFYWAGIIYFLLAIACVLPYTKNKLKEEFLSFILLIPLISLAFGFGIRVYITEFPPVTNMYGTMIWVSFGISLFSYIFYLIYRDLKILAIMSFGTALLLLLTENIPLIISPNMDPIVAVLRSSYWLTIHVLTVTISYAAFSMAMILGNIILVKSLMGKLDQNQIKEFSHYAYRSIQLGVLLLTAGIILGGVWADYSWGRFWGWDPKETWALIADLGFLAILHGRFAGWISPKRLLIFSPLAYVLVVMAWFGVNFILATGLHSYGFSSGGTFMVVAFVATQLILYVLYFFKLMFNSKKQSSNDMNYSN